MEDGRRHHGHRNRRENLRGGEDFGRKHISRRSPAAGGARGVKVNAADAHRMARLVGARSRYIFFGAFERVFDNKTVRWKIVPRYKRIAFLLSAAFVFIWISAAVAGRTKVFIACASPGKVSGTVLLFFQAESVKPVATMFALSMHCFNAKVMSCAAIPQPVFYS